MGKIEEIKDGYTELAKEIIGGEQQDFVGERYRHCQSCNLFTGTICSPGRMTPHIKTGVITKGCGCLIKAKVRSKNSKCPVGKW